MDDQLLLAELRALREAIEGVGADVKRLHVFVLSLKKTKPAPTSYTYRRWLSIAETAERLGCSHRQVFRYIGRGDLATGRRFGRESTVTLASVEALEAGPGVQAAPRRPSTVIPRPFDLEKEQAALDEWLRSQAPEKKRPRR